MDTSDRIEHEAEVLAGQAKEAAGDATGNRSLQAEGITEQAVANTEKAVDGIREGVDDARHDRQQ